MRLGDRVVVMNDGRIEQNGTVEEVYNAPATAFVATFVGDTNVFYGELAGVDGEYATVETEYGSFTASTDTLNTSPEALLGERVVLAIRPQNLKLAGGAENTLQCAVEDVIHRPGRGTQIPLEAGRAESTTELQLVTYEQRNLDAGTVSISWNPADAILLERVSVAEDVDLQTDILGE
jgi:ABC-type Fe3+/spermidine/putrescine transport system ATPase subunit